MSTRRRFLQLIGLAPAAAAIGSVQGGPPPNAYYPSQLAGRVNRTVYDATGEVCPSPADYEDPISFVRQHGIPGWQLDKMRADAMREKNFYKIDADLCAMRSFSEATKQRLNAERHVKRECDRTFAQWAFNDIRNKFSEKFGGWWPF